MTETRTPSTSDEGHAAWHAGEQAMQRAAGSAEILEPAAARILKPALTEQQQAFFRLLSFVVVGWVDEDSRPWASIVFGSPGFARSNDHVELRIDARPVGNDPLARALRPGQRLGLLGIDLANRRRNRLNGEVITTDATGFTIEVHQSFGNCPQYIQVRPGLEAQPDPQAPPPVASFETLDEDAITLLRGCDTFFVASFFRHDDGSVDVDVSHRGGRPGFVKVGHDGVVTIPDFPGNRYFNTLGNILATGRAGLLVPDFRTGDLLMISGTAEVGMSDLDLEELAPVARAERLWRVRPTKGLWLRDSIELTRDMIGWSPQSLSSGVWP